MKYDQDHQNRWNDADHYLVGGCLLTFAVFIIMVVLVYAALEGTT